MFLLLFAVKKKNRREQNEFDDLNDNNIISEFSSSENSKRSSLLNRSRKNSYNSRTKIENDSHRSSKQIIFFNVLSMH